MAGFAGPALATQVYLNGGMGFYGSLASMKQLDTDLDTARKLLNLQQDDKLRIGVGLLLFAVKREEALHVVAKHKPAAVWLFAAQSTSDYAAWAAELRAASPDSAIWIQCGGVAAALEIAKTAKPDVLVAQGTDAGGHGFEKGAGIISLVPEVLTALEGAGLRKRPAVVAAGGIVDGRGVAAALALGAQGVVLGTRFLASEEAILHKSAQAAVVAAKDGGQNTVRAKVFDELKGPNIWPGDYDGRSIVTASYMDYRNGMNIEENRGLHKSAVALEDGGFGKESGQGRATIWAGTGVGLVKGVQRAGEILEDVRRETRAALDNARVVSML